MSGFYVDLHPPPGSTDGPGKPGCSVGTFHLVPCWTEVPEGRAVCVPKGVSWAKDGRPPGQRSAKQLGGGAGDRGESFCRDCEGEQGGQPWVGVARCVVQTLAPTTCPVPPALSRSTTGDKVHVRGAANSRGPRDGSLG